MTMDWPTQNDVISVFGDPRDPDDPTRANPLWESDNLVSVKPPFALTYLGKPVKSVRCHWRVASSFTGALETIRDKASNDIDLLQEWGITIFGGSYNYRLMRGLNTLSMHSYGIAFDFDPERNALNDPNPHFLGIPEVREAWELQDATWGGLFTRPDGMHWQFATI
jgi:hypothetical protein